MLEHEPPRQEPIHSSILNSRPPSDLPAAPASGKDPAQTRLNTYLDKVCASLAATLSETELGERRLEMQTHLEELIAAHEELDCTREEAITHALEQFGKTRFVTAAWEQVVPNSSFSGRQATGIALGLYGVTALFWYLNLLRNVSESPLFLGLLFVPAGLVTGFLTCRRALKGALCAQSMLFVPMVALTFRWLIWPKVEMSLLDAGEPVSLSALLRLPEIMHRMHGPGMLLLFASLSLLAAYWMLTGILAAGAGSWLRKQIERRRRRLALS